MSSLIQTYRGRLAPSPTGYLHLGHAKTFWTAYERALANEGLLVFRNEDLDPQRSRPEFRDAMFEDLRWLGIAWQEGPDRGGEFGPYSQSERRAWYLDAWQKLRAGGWIYPCTCSRKELGRVDDAADATQAPHEIGDEPRYSGKCRGRASDTSEPAGVNWRFRVPDGRQIRFDDLNQGEQRFTAGVDFGDFVVWRRDDVPAYQLAVVVDDDTMQITEVVRGCDLLKSTARQLLLMEALAIVPPAYFHCELVADASGARLAKRCDALSLRHLRETGVSSEGVRGMWLLSPESVEPK